MHSELFENVELCNVQVLEIGLIINLIGYINLNKVLKFGPNSDCRGTPAVVTHKFHL